MALKGPRPLPSPPPSGQPDPFLAQSLDIPLTARDRQEGYDVDLLNARPRGVSATSTNGAAASDTAVEAAGGSGGAGATEAEKYAARNKEEDNALSSSRAALAGDEDRPRRRSWFLRPLSLALVFLLLALALGLGIGLGVGLRHSSSTSSSAGAAPRGNSTTSELAANSTSLLSSSRTRTATTGTVIPSSISLTSSPSLFTPSSTISDPRLTPTTISRGIAGNSTDSEVLASTGNLPIPEASATTIGTVVVSSINRGVARRRRAVETGGWS